MLRPLLQAWLRLQCQMIPGAIGAYSTLKIGTGAAATASVRWPSGYSPSPRLLDVARWSLAERTPVAQATIPGGETAHRNVLHAACLLAQGDRVVGVVAFEIEASVQQRDALVQLLRWGAAWLDQLLRVQIAATHRDAVLVKISHAALTQDGVEAAAIRITTELATRLRCDRVSLGLIEGGRVRLCALSHGADFDRRSNFVVALETAMDEAVANKVAAVWPQDTPVQAAPALTAHRQLAEAKGGVAILRSPCARRKAWSGR